MASTKNTTAHADLEIRLKSVLPFLTQHTSLMELALQHGRLATFEPDQFICMEGNMCAAFPVVLKGSARVYKTGESGREITLYRLNAGDSCILTTACILDGQVFPAFARVEQTVEAFIIPPAVLQSWVKEYDAWRKYVFNLLASRLHRVIAVIEEVVFRRLDVRLVDFLLQECDSDGIIATTHETIAAELGSSREVVSRLLKEFEHEGLVYLERKKVRVAEREGLKQRVSGVV